MRGSVGHPSFPSELTNEIPEHGAATPGGTVARSNAAVGLKAYLDDIAAMVKRVVDSAADMQQAERATLDFLRQWTQPGKSPLCGNTIGHDRRFLARHMPSLERWLHYRNLDVSTIKELARRWAPDVADAARKDSAHTALSDIRDSVSELRHYRSHMAALAL